MDDPTAVTRYQLGVLLHHLRKDASPVAKLQALFLHTLPIVDDPEESWLRSYPPELAISREEAELALRFQAEEYAYTRHEKIVRAVVTGKAELDAMQARHAAELLECRSRMLAALRAEFNRDITADDLQLAEAAAMETTKLLQDPPVPASSSESGDITSEQSWLESARRLAVIWKLSNVSPQDSPLKQAEQAASATLERRRFEFAAKPWRAFAQQEYIDLVAKYRSQFDQRGEVRRDET